MLALTDPAWSGLQANYTDGAHVAELLGRAERGEPLQNWYDELFQELCHQYTVSPAALLAAPHLLRLATHNAETRVELLVLLGACHTYADAVLLAAMEADIAEEWRWSARQAQPLLAEQLAQGGRNPAELRYLLVSMAAVQGHPQLAAQIEALDDG